MVGGRAGRAGRTPGRLAAIAAVCALTAACVDPDAAREPYVAPDTVAPLDATAPDATTPADTDALEADSLDTDDAKDTADTPAPGPTLPPESPSILRLYDGDARYAAALADGATLVVTADAWLWIDALGPRAITLDPALAPILVALPDAPPTALALVDDGAALISVAGTLLRLHDGVLGPTPLADAVAPDPITALVPAGPATLWLAGADDLYRWRADHLAPVAPGTLPHHGARLAFGAPVEATAALWIAAGDAVYALTEVSGGLVAWPEQPALAATALAADAVGRLWALAADGAVTQRTPDAVWRPIPLPSPVAALAASPDAPDAWLASPDGRLYHASATTLTEITGPPPVRHLAATPTGAALVSHAAGVDQLSPGRVLDLGGLNPDAVLAAPRDVVVRATDAAAVASVTADLDGASLVVVPEGDGPARTWLVTLDPVALVNGPHRLEVTVTWDDALTLTAALPFQVAFPTWGADVGPLYDRRCASCHAPVAGASTAVLDTPASWSSRIDCVVCRVAVPFDLSRPECQVCHDGPSSMPPTGPLPEAEVELIQQWRAGGFREE